MRIVDHDWSEIIFDLKRMGMSHSDICSSMGRRVTESMIRQYMAGAQPMHWRGELLIELWRKKTGRPREDAPKRPAPLTHIVHDGIQLGFMKW